MDESLGSYFEAAQKSDGEFWGYKTKRFGALPAKSSLCAQLLIDDKILQVARQCLTPEDDTSIQINLTQGIAIMPGEKAQIIHRDDNLFPFSSQRELMINFLFAVDDFTQANGATRLISGSHTWDRDRIPEADDTVFAEMTAGSVLIYFGSVLHAGSANLSDKSRRAIVLSYNLGFLRQSENLTLSIPWEKMLAFPEELQRLLGYQITKPNVGWVEGMEPLEWIKRGRPELIAAVDSIRDEQTIMIKTMRDSPERSRFF